MSPLKSLALGVFAWVALGSLAYADPQTWGGGNWSWTNWVPTQGDLSNLSTLQSVLAAIAPDGTPTTATSPNFSSSAPSQNPVFTPIASNNLNSSTITPAAALTSFSAPTAPAASSGPTYDAYLNFGTGNFPEASQLTTGNAQPWYESPSVKAVFGGVAPNTQQQVAFETTVLARVEQTFQLSGLNPTVTLDPSAQANHTISIVSGTSYAPNPNAIGITDVGGNGFGFIDKLSYAQNVDQLEWAVAHNVTHELMHAFGVAVHHDQTGTFLDAATASWALLTNPDTVLSPAAVQDILAHNYGRNLGSNGTLGAEGIDGDQTVTVPEPATVAFWAIAVAGGLIVRRRTARRLAA